VGSTGSPEARCCESGAGSGGGAGIFGARGMRSIVDNRPMHRLWDVFCRVIDNFGDIGVCWRLTADLAARGQSVRLWVDDGSALRWMAPGALEGRWPRVTVLPWSWSAEPERLASMTRAEVLIEGFGCEAEPAFLEWHFAEARRPQVSPLPAAPAWIDLEYFSAEAYALRSHALPSPQWQGPAQGQVRHFFFPGLSPHSGGLLREPDLSGRKAAFDRVRWLRQWGVDGEADALVASLFCYEPLALGGWLDRCRSASRAVELLVTPGRAARAVAAWLGHDEVPAADGKSVASVQAGQLRCTFLPWLTQTAFDELLWSCDLNFVRGEDSLARALWAGQPFVWQIYPQNDGAHRAKLEALLVALDAPASWRAFHLAWNGLTEVLPAEDLPAWRACVRAAATVLAAEPDLTTRLMRFTGDPAGGRKTTLESS
jgi:uncharacterized repeat protein (TIGR03837 family)